MDSGYGSGDGRPELILRKLLCEVSWSSQTRLTYYRACPCDAQIRADVNDAVTKELLC